MVKIRSNLIAVGATQLVGKTTFANLFKELFESQYPDWTVIKESFAQPLRKELNEIILPKFGINLFDCNSEQKELFRPLMIEFAKIRRKLTKGTYYTSILEDKIIKKSSYRENAYLWAKDTIYIIDDFRYTSEVSGYQQDEDTWIKKMGGIIVHLSRFETIPPFIKFIEPTIPDEIINNSIIEKIADYRVWWETTDNIEDRKKHIKKFIDWFVK